MMKAGKAVITTSVTHQPMALNMFQVKSSSFSPDIHMNCFVNIVFLTLVCKAQGDVANGVAPFGL